MTVRNGYTTADALRERLRDSQAKLDPELLDQAINAASRAIDAWCGRRFWADSAPTARLYRPRAVDTAVIDDVSTSSGLTVKTDTAGDGTYATTWATSDWLLEPVNADAYQTADGAARGPWWQLTAVGTHRFARPGQTRGRPYLQVTTRWGWPQPWPADVEEACLLKAARLFKRGEAIFGISGFSEFGTVRITRADDPDAAALLQPYVRLAGVDA